MERRKEMTGEDSWRERQEDGVTGLMELNPFMESSKSLPRLSLLTKVHVMEL